MKSFSDSYKAAGVDVTAGYRAVDLMKNSVARTKLTVRFPVSAASAACSSLILPAWSSLFWFPAPTAWGQS